MCICAHLQLCDCAQIVSVAAFVALSNDGMRMLQERCYSDIWAREYLHSCTYAVVHSGGCAQFDQASPKARLA